MKPQESKGIDEFLRFAFGEGIEQGLIARAQEMDEDQQHWFLEAMQPRIRGLAEITSPEGPGLFALLRAHEIVYDERAMEKWIRKPGPDGTRGVERLQALKPVLRSVDPFTPEAIEAAIQKHCEDQGIGMGKAAQPLRVAVTGKAQSPPLGLTLAILGRTETLARVGLCTLRFRTCKSSKEKETLQ